MKNIKKIINKLNKIEYGFLDNEGNNIFNYKNVQDIFNGVYYLLSPEELLKKNVGVCSDLVELERKLCNENNIKNETYFICFAKNHLIFHTFLVYYDNNKVYWFEYSWFDEKGIHEYNNLIELLNDIEIKFINSKKDEMKNDFVTHIYKYNKPDYNISCDEFLNYVFTQKEVFNFKIENSTINDIERIKNYKLKSIVDYDKNLSINEIDRMKNFINKNIPIMIKEYKNIIYDENIIGSFLVRKIDDGLLLDEIFIEKEYRNKGIGSSIINNYILTSNENIFLWVYKDNVNAFNLYKKLGFIIKEETYNRYYMEFLKDMSLKK